MVQAIQSLKLDVFRRDTIPVVYTKKDDSNSRFICAEITSGGRAISIPVTATACINAYRPDGVENSFDGSVQSNGTILVPIDEWMCAVEGVVRCDISISDGSSRLTTLDFLLVVKSRCGVLGGLGGAPGASGGSIDTGVYVDGDTLVIASDGYVDSDVLVIGDEASGVSD